MVSPSHVFDLGLGARLYDALTGQSLWREQIARVLDVAGDLPAGPRVLDLGCGPGVSTFVLGERLGPDASLVGIDLAGSMIARAERHHAQAFSHLDTICFQQADATALPFDDGSFDLAVGHSFLYLVPDRPAVLSEIRRVLAPGAAIVLMEPDVRGSLPRALFRAGASVPRATARPMDTLRFGASMVGWRLFSRWAGGLAPGPIHRLFHHAGFVDVACHETLGGLGLHAVGRTPNREV